MTTLNAITATNFVNSLGINTHIDFSAYGYQNLSTVEAAINYLGIKNLRDSASNGYIESAWAQVVQATGARFDDYIGETSPSGMQNELGLVQQLAQAGLLNAVEGGNEEDDSYPQSLGNNLYITAQFQQQIAAVAQQFGLPSINMSFGAGWTAANNWHGNYDKVGDLSAYATYGNAHTYPNPGQTPDAAIQQINGDARLAAASRPVITTEMGWNTSNFSQGAVAQYVVQAALDGIKEGDAKTYFYALFNDGSGNFGLMNADGSPTPAGTSLHNLTTLLADSGGNNFATGSLDFTLNGADGSESTVLIQKSDGSKWLALWDETGGTHSVTVNLGTTASQIQVFDPVTGTSAIASANNSNSITVSLGNDPLLIEVVPSGSTTATTPTTASQTPTTTTSSGSTATTPTTPTTTGSNTNAGSTSVLSLSAPASVQDTNGQSVAVSGVQVAGDYASTHQDILTATITDSSGTLSTVNAWGNPQQGQGASGLTLTGTIWQVNGGLGNLRYTGSGSDTISIKVTDQFGGQTTKIIAVNGGSTTTPTTTTTTAATPSTPTPAPAPAANQIAASDSQPVITASNTSYSASSGDHMIFIAGTGDTLTATGGTESVQAYNGGNSITTGAGNDAIRIGGSGSTVNAGAGSNHIEDSGNNNTIVLPGANQGYDDIYGWVMQNGDTFDLRSLLAATSWNGTTATIGDFVKVNNVNGSAIIAVDPTGQAGGATYNVATLNASGNMGLSTLLAHSIT